MSKAMRMKYGAGVVSDHFIETGVPQIQVEQIKALAKQKAVVEKAAKKETKKAETAARRSYKKRCKKTKDTPAENIVFC